MWFGAGLSCLGRGPAQPGASLAALPGLRLANVEFSFACGLGVASDRPCAFLFRSGLLSGMWPSLRVFICLFSSSLPRAAVCFQAILVGREAEGEFCVPESLEAV